jgi:glycosyltransferase involved in cell wall biosynthesis
MRESLDGGSETLVVPLSGGSLRATNAVRQLLGAQEPILFPLARLADGGRRVLLERRYDGLALVGAPPADELGYCLGTLIALMGRPRRVALVDLAHGQVSSESLVRYVARSAPFAIGQLGASALAVGAQRAAIPLVGRPQRLPMLRPALSNLVYLRPGVGAASAVGGSVTHSHGVIRALRAAGVEVRAFTTDKAIAETAASEPQPPCQWRVVRTPRSLKAVAASSAVGADVALARASLSSGRAADAIYQRHARFSIVGALLARLTGRPLILEYNGSEEFVDRYWDRTTFRRRIAHCERAALAAAARIIVVSDVDRRSLVERGIDPARIVLNPNGVDADRFAVGGGSEARRRHGIADDRLVFGFVGSFGPWHGTTVLARAFASVAASLPRAHLLLVGDGRELEATWRLIRDAGLEGATTLVGQVPPAEIPAYLDASDILVSPHVPLPDGVEFFGSPTKLFEYMAAGKAIVASRLGQIGDVLEHRVTAWLVEPGDVTGLAEALRSLADAPGLRRELGVRARRQAVERHSWDLNARRVMDAYASLAEETR